MEQRQQGYFLLKVLYLAVAGIIVTQAFGQTGLTSLIFLLTFPVTALLFFQVVHKKITGMDWVVLATAALAFANVLINAVIADGDLTFDYIRKVIMFTVTLLYLQTVSRMRVGQNVVRFVDIIVDILTIFFIVIYFLRFVEMHLLNGRVTRYLTFRFANPNLAGMFLTCLYMLEAYRLFRPEKWYWKILHVVMAVFLAWFVFETESRNCLLVLALYTVVCAWLTFRGRGKFRIGGVFASLVAMFPAIFMFIYGAVITAPWFQNAFSFLVGEGKGLDSRSGVWQVAWEKLWASPLVGAYCEISNGTGTAQMHNSHLDIACSYGIPVLVLVCVLLGKFMYQDGRVYRSKESFMYILGFACALMMGIGEAALFSGGLGIYILVGTFLLLANRKMPEEDDGGSDEDRILE